MADVRERKMKRAICVGINNYPGTANDLEGCVNDALDWEDFLDGIGFETTTLLDSSANKASILSALSGLVRDSQSGDVAVFCYSGHGTRVDDVSGDETQDGLDEALYVYDGVVTDDQLRGVLEAIGSGVSFVVILDSCFAGTGTHIIAPQKKRARRVLLPHTGTHSTGGLRKIVSDTNDILIAACGEEELSSEDTFSGRANGAFTHYALQILKSHSGMSYQQFLDVLGMNLPSRNYPQTPQLECTPHQASFEVFGADDVPVPPIPVPPPDPTPTPEPDGCLPTLIKTLLGTK
jgi:hypothetical protein